MFGRVALLCALCVCVVCEDTHTSVLRTTPEQILADGYPSETHVMTTIDGYLLEMHRIPHGRVDDGAVGRPVVFVMHGLTAHSGYFTLLGPEHSLAYNLADAGFDVWLGNARGNKYSRAHVSLDPDDRIHKYSFFDFTFEEIGLHDLPTMIDYILELTDKQKLHYIGHSQGGTVFLVLGALRNEYNVKIASAHLLAPVGYQDHFPDVELAAISTRVDTLYNIALLLGIVEFFPGLLDELPVEEFNVADYCTGHLQHKHMCEVFGMHYFLRENDEDAPEPGGASVKQFVHFGQNVRDKLFRRYHYGIDSNRIVYGLDEPPLYDISLITADVTLHYSVNDHVLDERDVLAMAAEMPNAKVRRVARESFLHNDFYAVADAKELVTDYIIEQMRNTPDYDEPIEGTTLFTSVNIVDHTTVSPTDQPGDTTNAPSDDLSSTPTLVTDETTTTPAANSAASVLVNGHLMIFVLYLLFK